MARKQWKSTDGTVASAVPFQTRGGTMYTVVFTYKVDGSWYGGTFTSASYLTEGDRLAVEYDPHRPDVNNFTKREKLLRFGYTLFFIALAILAIYLFATKPK